MLLLPLLVVFQPKASKFLGAKLPLVVAVDLLAVDLPALLHLVLSATTVGVPPVKVKVDVVEIGTLVDLVLADTTIRLRVLDELGLLLRDGSEKALRTKCHPS